jgi:glycosyltransferase involved in cell wall biosynthesis
VIYNGTDFPSVGGEETPSAQTARTPQSGELVGRQPFILYVGGFLAHKNVPTLLASFQELASALPHHLVLVGGGSESERKKLGPLAARLGIAERVHVYHGIPARELVALYRSCDLFVYPSRYEGFGLPVLEAMACGAPVLCSSATAMPEVGGDAVRYFSPDSRDELTAGMRAVLIDRGLREQLVARGLERAARFTWKRTVAAYSRVIREVLSRGTDRG